MMSISADYHLHTDFSSDSKTPMEEMIQAGIRKGLRTMCFTEHMDYDYPLMAGATEPEFLLDTDAYFVKNKELAPKYADKCDILFGIELGLQPHLTKKLANLTSSYPFDFVIGSVHQVDGMDPYYPEYFDKYEEKRGYQRYFEYGIECIKAFSDFDTLGHLDYIVRYGPNQNKYYSYKEYSDYIDEILKLLIQKGIALEVNTGSFKYGMNVTNPNLDIIKAYKNMGGELITVGSDAHVPEFIANKFDLVKELLQQVGFKYYTEFKARKARFTKLD